MDSLWSSPTRPGPGFKTGLEYKDLTDNYFAKRDPATLAKQLIRRLADLGLEVEVTATA